MTSTARAARPKATPTTDHLPSAGSLVPRRSVPHLLVGAFLVLIMGLVFATVARRTDARVEVLAVDGAVPAGHVLAPGDLRVVRIAPDPQIAVVRADRRGTVLGKSVTVPLAARSLLSEQVIGPAAWPPAGHAVIAVSVKPGRAPAGLAAGARVAVFAAPPAGAIGGTTGGVAGVRADGTVVRVTTGDRRGVASPDATVSLLLPASDAERIARADGDMVLVLTAGER